MGVCAHSGEIPQAEKNQEENEENREEEIMAPKIKLTYFQLKGRGEISRLILAAGNLPFDDHRIEFGDWMALKPSKEEKRSISFIAIYNSC